MLAQNRSQSVTSKVNAALETHANVLHRYRLQGLPVRQIKEQLLHEFDITASEQQIDRFFKRSGNSKKRKSEEWPAIGDAILRKRLRFDCAEVEIDGIFISREKVKRNLSRQLTASKQFLMNKNLFCPLDQSTSTPHNVSISAGAHKIRVWPALQALRPGKYIMSTSLSELLSVSTTFIGDDVVDVLSKHFLNSTLHQPLCGNRLMSFTDLSDSGLFVQSSDLQSTKETANCFEGPNASLLEAVPVFAARLLEKFKSSIFEHEYGEFGPQLAAIRYQSPAQILNRMFVFFIYIICNDLGDQNFHRLATKVLFLSAVRSFTQRVVAQNNVVSQAFTQRLMVIACQNLDVDILDALITLNVDLNKILVFEPYSKPMTPLSYCMYKIIDPDLHAKSLLQFSETLLRAGADPNRCSWGTELLHSLHESENVCSDCHNCSKTPLSIVTSNISIPGLVEQLVNYGAIPCFCHSVICGGEDDVSVEDLCAFLKVLPRSQPNRYRDYISSALEAAVDLSRTDLIDILLDEGIKFISDRPCETASEPSDQDEAGLTTDDAFMNGLLLLMAIYRKYDNAIRILLAKRANVNFFWDLDQERFQFLSGMFSNSHDVIRLTGSRSFCAQSWLEGSEDTTICSPLHFAITFGTIRHVRMVLLAGASLQCRGGMSPLVLAVRTGSVELVKLLLQFGVNVDETPDTDNTQLSALAEASARSHVEILELLLEAGADVNVSNNKDGLTPLQAAILFNSTECIDILLNHRDLDIWRPASRLTKIDALTATVLSSNVPLFDRFIDVIENTYPHSQIDLQCMAIAAVHTNLGHCLDWALRMGANLYVPAIADCVSISVNRLQLLLDRGVQLHTFVAETTFFAAIWRAALHHNSFTVIDMLLRSTMAIENSLVTTLCDGLRSWLCNRSSDGTENRMKLAVKIIGLLNSRQLTNSSYQICIHLKTLVAFLQLRVKCSGLAEVIDTFLATISPFGIDESETCCTENEEVLFWACRTGNRGILQLLFDSGILPRRYHSDCVANRRFRSTALCISIAQRKIAMVTDLLQHGADWNVKSLEDGMTPLELACKHNELEILKVLLLNGARLSTDSLMIAVEHGNTDVVSELIHYGADVNRISGRGSYGRCILASCVCAYCSEYYENKSENRDRLSPFYRTLLQTACQGGYTDIVKLLIIHKANVNYPASPCRGITALQAAAIKGHLNICRILVEQGARIDGAASPHKGLTAVDGAAKFGRIDVLKFLLDNYDGREPIEQVCQSARTIAKANGMDFIVTMLKDYKQPSR